MRRCTVFEGLNQEAEFFVTFLFGKTEHLEHLSLQILIVNSDRTAAKLYAVQYDVICIGFDSKRICVEQVYLIQLRAGKRVVHSLEGVVFLVFFEHREVHDPQQIILIIIEQSHSLRTFTAEETEGIIGYLRSVGADEDEVVLLCVENLCDFRELFRREELIHR